MENNQLPDSLLQQAALLEEQHPSAFYISSAEYCKQEKFPEAAFLFYLGQLRYRYFYAANPACKEAEDGALLASLNEVVGTVINGWLGKHKTIWVDTIEAVQAWDATHDFIFYSKQNNQQKQADISNGLNKLLAMVKEI